MQMSCLTILMLCIFINTVFMLYYAKHLKLRQLQQCLIPLVILSGLYCSTDSVKLSYQTNMPSWVVCAAAGLLIHNVGLLVFFTGSSRSWQNMVLVIGFLASLFHAYGAYFSSLKRTMSRRSVALVDVKDSASTGATQSSAQRHLQHEQFEQEFASPFATATGRSKCRSRCVDFLGRFCCLLSWPLNVYYARNPPRSFAPQEQQLDDMKREPLMLSAMAYAAE